MSISGLLLDAENLLFDATYPLRWLHRQLAPWGLGLSFDSLWQRWVAASGLLYDHQQPLKRVLEQLLTGAGLRPAAASELAWAAQSQFARHYRELRPLPRVVATTLQLHSQGFVLGVVGNSLLATGRVSEYFQTHGIPIRWNCVQTSTSAGQSLPSPQVLLDACAQLRLAPHQVAYVTREIERLETAGRAGLATILCAPLDGAGCDWYVERLERLPELQLQLAERRAAG